MARIYKGNKTWYLDFTYSRVNKAPGSYRRDETNMKHLLDYFRGKFITEIASERIEKYKVERRKQVPPAFINREIATLSHMFTLAFRWELIPSNPVTKIKKNQGTTWTN